MKYVTVDSPLKAAVCAMPDDLLKAALYGYREAMGMGEHELPVIEW